MFLSCISRYLKLLILGIKTTNQQVVQKRKLCFKSLKFGEILS